MLCGVVIGTGSWTCWAKAVPTNKAPIPSVPNAPSAIIIKRFRTMSVCLIMLLPLVIKALKEVVI